jgi:hypothetical protein
MSVFEVQCTVGRDHFCIEVPNDCSVGDVLKKVSEQSGLKGVSLWYSDIALNLDHLFADYFEPEGVYQVKLGGNIPEGTLLNSSESKVRALGVTLEAPQLLMEARGLTWSMDEFLEKAGDLAPTLMLIKMENGTECGGVAGVPWPKRGGAVDWAEGSFIFSLGAAPARFDLVRPGDALYCCPGYFQFGLCSAELFVFCDGRGCGSNNADGEGTYAGPREKGQLVGATAGNYTQPYERWELWRLCFAAAPRGQHGRL